MDRTEILPSNGKEIEIVKLAFLATTGDITTNHRLSRQGENVMTVLEEAIQRESVAPVRDFGNKILSYFNTVTYSQESYGNNWLQKADFMTWIETMKHLSLDTAGLDQVEEVKDKCCVDDIDQGAFMFNENLVMSEICDIMTVEQVKALGVLCSNKVELETINYVAPGMKELVFFFTIRCLELQGKFNTLFTDRLLQYIEEIRPSVGNTEKLDQVSEILERYEIKVQPAGYCLVFCMTEGRKGANKEIDNIKSVFGELLGYKVNVVKNPTNAEIAEIVDQCSAIPALSIFDSLVCWVLGHGDTKSIKLSGKEKIKREEFLQLFSKVKCFSKKPKLFFMGTCQGNMAIPVVPSTGGHDAGSDGDAGPVAVPTLSEANFEILTVHTQSDRLIAYATMPDHLAFRDDTTGSIFVSFICEQIAMLKNQPDSSINVVKILQRTARKLQSILFNPRLNIGLGKQACYYESTMQKEFFFRLAPKHIVQSKTQ